MIISYAQGMHLLANASAEYKYELKLDEIAKYGVEVVSSGHYS